MQTPIRLSPLLKENPLQAGSGQSGGPQEGRRFVRVDHRVPVWVISRSPGESALEAHVATAISCNISLGGMCLRSKVPLNSTHLHIKFQVPTGNYVTTACRVVRSMNVGQREWEYGIQFEKPIPPQSLDFADIERQEQQRLAVLSLVLSGNLVGTAGSE